MLEKKYSTDHDGTFSYIDPITLITIPLTPYMMKEWACTMVCSMLVLIWCIYWFYISMMIFPQWTAHQTLHHLIQQFTSHCSHPKTVYKAPHLQVLWRSQLCQLSLPCLHWLLPSCVQAMPCLCHPPLVQNSTTNQPAPHQHLTSCLQHPIKARTLSQSCRAEQYPRSGILPPHALRERVWARHHAPCQHWWPQQHWHGPRWCYLPEGICLKVVDQHTLTCCKASPWDRGTDSCLTTSIWIHAPSKKLHFKKHYNGGGAWWLSGLLSSQGAGMTMQTMHGGFTQRNLACSSPSLWERCLSFLTSKTFLVLTFHYNTLYFYMCCHSLY